MFNRWLMLVVLMVFLTTFSACAGTQSAQRNSLLNSNWGRSFETQRYNQILNPEAGKDLAPVTGLDGQVAEKNMERYRGGGTNKKTMPQIGILTIKNK